MTLAILNGSYQCVKFLANHGQDCQEFADDKDNTYLHIAAISGHVVIFLFFLSK
jgi:ankyrin repeat protein